MKNCATMIFAVSLWFFAIGCSKSESQQAMPLTLTDNTFYNSDTNHLWNRLNETLFVRTAQDGKKYSHAVDILYWSRTTNLLTGVSHQQTLSVLDEFINQHGEKLIHDPLKRALLQHDLWALFDWTAIPNFYHGQFGEERRELQRRLVIVMRRLALTTDEITSLPDNYFQADAITALTNLPHGMFQKNGDWISIGIPGGEPVVPTHVRGFGGRSVFLVMFHDADGRQAGLDYLKQLCAFKPMLVRNTNSPFANEPVLNRDLPQFPTNSQWALVRRMCVIDIEGHIRPTHIVETIQLRTYRSLHSYVTDPRLPEQHGAQQVNEFEMSRKSNAALFSVPEDGKNFDPINIFSMGIDPFERRPPETKEYNSAEHQFVILKSCAECHEAPGIRSVNSFTRRLSAEPSFETTQITDSDVEREATVTIDWKNQQFDWGLLQGLWNQEN